jgi:chemotaxis receptor (MCP) glutamine deamidase CheD
MLPGSARDPTLSAKTEYSLNAIPELIRKMSALGADVVTLRVWLIGGGNLLGPGHESPGAETVSSLVEVLREMKLGVVAKEVGGTQRRSCCLNVATGRVSYTVGESERLTLWEPGGE